MEKRSVSTQTLQRLPLYLNYLRSLPKGKSENISATAIADALRLGEVQVRKDLALVSSGGRPKVGYVTRELTSDIENFLGYHDVETAVLVGAGDLGHSLLSYDGFSGYGLEIAAAFDRDPALVGTTIAGKRVLSMEKLVDLCCRMQIHMGNHCGSRRGGAGCLRHAGQQRRPCHLELCAGAAGRAGGCAGSQ